MLVKYCYGGFLLSKSKYCLIIKPSKSLGIGRKIAVVVESSYNEDRTYSAIGC